MERTKGGMIKMSECHVSKGKFMCDQDPEFIKCRNKAIEMAKGFYNTFKDEKGKSFKVRVDHENLPLEKDNHNGVLYYDFNILIRNCLITSIFYQ